MDLTAPILFLIFNRPATTQRVFNAIRQAKPLRLFVAADGPRIDCLGEIGLCEQTRRIIDSVDWNCEVVTLYRDKNLGCRQAVSSAINWFFSHVEEGIILEDDCLPNQSFFGYCQELLEYYRFDTRVMQICGLNVLKKWNRNGYSYFYSNYGPVWGWATWRRAWKSYDVDMTLWPEIRKKKYFEDFCQNMDEVKFRVELYDRVYNGKIDTWDYQWGFAKMVNRGMSVIPSSNMINNIGFSDDATHTLPECNSPYASMKTFELNLPINHPPYVIRDCQADRRYLNEFTGIKPTKKSLKQLLLNLLRL